MKTVLSIQSHVSYGYVGNRAAVFPLQRMGIDVHVINTVQFSNHTGYGQWTGQVFNSAHIQDLLNGLEHRGVFENLDAVLTGYIGAKELGETVIHAVEKIRTTSPDLIYCCDPVMGDTGKGFYVDDDIPPFFRDSAMPQSQIVTPNQFELSALTGTDIQTISDAQQACAKLHDIGPDKILLTSLITQETKQGDIGMMLSEKNGTRWLINTPKLALDPEPNGAGDMSAALFLGYILKGQSPKTALEQLASNIHNVFLNTEKEGRRELALIQSQDEFMKNTLHFEAREI